MGNSRRDREIRGFVRRIRRRNLCQLWVSRSVRVISAATGGSINSRTTANPPLSSTALASFSKAISLFGRSAFDPVTSLFKHVLRQHSDVSDKRDTRSSDCPDLRGASLPAFQFHCVSPGINQPLRAGYREIHVVIAVDREVGHQEGGRRAPCHRSSVMDNVFKLNMSRVRVSKHHHSKRVAHQKEIDSGFVQKLCRGIVVGRESRNPLMSFSSSFGWYRE